jgi:hypothetical protein
MEAAKASLPINFVFNHSVDNERTQNFSKKVLQVAKNLCQKFKDRNPKRYEYQIHPISSVWTSDTEVTNIRKHLTSIGFKGIVKVEKEDNIPKIKLYSHKKIKENNFIFGIGEKKYRIRNAMLIEKPILFIYNIIVEGAVEEVLLEMSKEIGEIHKIRKPTSAIHNGTASISFKSIKDIGFLQLKKIRIFNKSYKLMWHRDVLLHSDTYVVKPKENPVEGKKEEKKQDPRLRKK